MQIAHHSLFDKEMVATISWHDYPDEANYEAAYEYLSLLNLPKKAKALTEKLRDGELVLFRKADDIIRAAGHNILPMDDIGVQRAIRQIHSKTKLAPLLLISAKHQDRIHIADGYHRACAVYYLAEGSRIPCFLTEWEDY